MSLKHRIRTAIDELAAARAAVDVAEKKLDELLEQACGGEPPPR